MPERTSSDAVVLDETKLMLLAAVIVMEKNNDIFKKAMDTAGFLLMDEPEEANRLLKSYGLNGLIVEYLSTDVNHEESAFVTSLSGWAREYLPNRKALLRLLLLPNSKKDCEEVTPDDIRQFFGDLNEMFKPSIVFDKMMQTLKENENLPSTANGYISLGVAFQGLLDAFKEYLDATRRKF